MKRLAPAFVAGALIVLWGVLSSRLPTLPVRVDIMLSSALLLTLVAVLVWGLLPLHTLGLSLIHI